ncbi:MAG: sigma-54 interaction domain-containing protein [Acidiferrobacter sp.]
MNKAVTPFCDSSIQSLIDMQDHPTVLIDRDYRIVAANRAYQSAYAVGAGLIGHHCYEVSHHRDRPCHLHGEDCPHLRVFATGQVQHVVHTHFNADNEPEYVRIKGHPVVTADGQQLLGESIRRLAQPAPIDCDDMRIIGHSPALLRAIDQLTHTAASDASVLLFGETGVGKELAARYVHDHSARRHRPFLAVDCTTLPETLFESEIFGHEAGAYTGCVGRKTGLFESADTGTLMLDEIGELPLPCQAKLLRLLESGEFRRLGGRTPLHADVRIIAATNRDLRQRVAAGLFREDLYYRIACITIALPPLRERRSDIPLLTDALLVRINTANGTLAVLSPEAIATLSSHPFPGNIRELRNILQRAVALCHDNVITSADLGLDTAAMASPAIEGGLRSHDDRDRLRDVMRLCAGNRRAMAATLGISERTLYRRLKHHGLP